MGKWTALILVWVPLALAGCGSGNSEPPPPAGSYEAASAFIADGKCDRAVPVLEPVARQGRGFEVAQDQLGVCQLQLAQKIADPALRSQRQAEAAKWILTAGNSGVTSAQQHLARMALDGIGMPADKIEAGKWATLFRRNPMRLQLGPSELDPALDKQLRDSLSSADWAAATARADQWRPTIQDVGPAADTTQPPVERPAFAPPSQTNKQRRPAG